MKKMKINIWSDVRCPFCYIGKRKFEKALNQFPEKDQIEIIWRSFELDPNLKTNPKINSMEYLAENKGMSRTKAEQMNQYVTEAAKEVNLELQFQKIIVANSFKAHKLIQLAQSKHLGNEAEESLFKAFFLEGKNIDDKDTLIQIGETIGLEKPLIIEALNSDDYSYKVRQDEAEAQAYGIQGVPYFVFNDKYAVSGAQPIDTFLGALQKSWEEFEKERKPVIIGEGSSCSTDGNCN